MVNVLEVHVRPIGTVTVSRWKPFSSLQSRILNSRALPDTFSAINSSRCPSSPPSNLMLAAGAVNSAAWRLSRRSCCTIFQHEDAGKSVQTGRTNSDQNSRLRQGYTSCLSSAAMPNTRNEKSEGEEIHHVSSPRARTASYWPAGQGAPLHEKVDPASSVPTAGAKAPRTSSRHSARRRILWARRTTPEPRKSTVGCQREGFLSSLTLPFTSAHRPMQSPFLFFCWKIRAVCSDLVQ